MCDIDCSHRLKNDGIRTCLFLASDYQSVRLVSKRLIKRGCWDNEGLIKYTIEKMEEFSQEELSI